MSAVSNPRDQSSMTSRSDSPSALNCCFRCLSKSSFSAWSAGFSKVELKESKSAVEVFVRLLAFSSSSVLFLQTEYSQGVNLAAIFSGGCLHNCMNVCCTTSRAACKFPPSIRMA